MLLCKTGFAGILEGEWVRYVRSCLAIHNNSRKMQMQGTGKHMRWQRRNSSCSLLPKVVCEPTCLSARVSPRSSLAYSPQLIINTRILATCSPPFAVAHFSRYGAFPLLVDHFLAVLAKGFRHNTAPWSLPLRYFRSSKQFVEISNYNDYWIKLLRDVSNTLNAETYGPLCPSLTPIEVNRQPFIHS